MKNKITIVIADDNPEFANYIKEALIKEGDLEVLGMAHNGNDAIDLIVGKQPDVALIDIVMPELDGLGVLEKLMSIPIAKKPKCLMLSAVGQDAITQKAMSLGAEYYIIKPFVPIDLSLILSTIDFASFLVDGEPTISLSFTSVSKTSLIELSFSTGLKISFASFM